MMLLDGVPIDADYILSLVVVDQVKVLQGGDYVLLLDGCPLANVAGEGEKGRERLELVEGGVTQDPLLLRGPLLTEGPLSS